MKIKASILLLLICIIPSCKKDKVIPTAGTITLSSKLTFDQNRQTPVGYGFTFSKAELVSNLANPGPDVFVYLNGSVLTFQTGNRFDSFYKFGEYNDETTASSEFSKLTAPSVPQWTGMASPLQANQIWLYKSGNEYYSKIRIISISFGVADGIDYGECTLEWRYQPDGSLTFPAR